MSIESFTKNKNSHYRARQSSIVIRHSQTIFKYIRKIQNLRADKRPENIMELQINKIVSICARIISRLPVRRKCSQEIRFKFSSVWGGIHRKSAGQYADNGIGNQTIVQCAQNIFW